MPQGNPLGLYKNAALDGTPIPYDILLLNGTILKAFTETASNDNAIPAGTDILVIYGDASVDAIIQLGDDVATPADAAYTEGLIYVPAQTVKIIDARDYVSYSIKAYNAGEAGQIVIECAMAYKDTRKPKQVDRG